MIFVIMGTERFAFTRLAEAVDRLAASGKLEDEVFFQMGHTPYEPKAAEHRDFLSFGEMCEKIQAADVVISHAGVGSTLLCLQHGKKPVLAPRFHDRGEHLDDHQQEFARKFHEAGMVVAVTDMADLHDAIESVRGHAAEARTTPRAAELTAYLDQLVSDL